MIFRECPVTPCASYAYNARYVSADGGLSINLADSGDYGVRPDLVENATE